MTFVDDYLYRLFNARGAMTFVDDYLYWLFDAPECLHWLVRAYLYLYPLLLVAIVWAISALVFIRFRAKTFGKRELYAKATGSTCRGVIYAFTKGMMPWAKESVRENLFSYAMGIAYHIGIFSAFVLFLWHFGILYPKFLRFPFFGLVLGVIPFFGLVLGVIGGVSLFIKRLVNPTLRGISCADDYISNIFTTAFLALSVPVHFFYPFHLPLVCPIWLFSAIVLFVYIPFSKMRHCLFFFSTRYHLGAFFGRRGCMPPSR